MRTDSNFLHSTLRERIVEHVFVGDALRAAAFVARPSLDDILVDLFGPLEPTSADDIDLDPKEAADD